MEKKRTAKPHAKPGVDENQDPVLAGPVKKKDGGRGAHQYTSNGTPSARDQRGTHESSDRKKKNVRRRREKLSGRGERNARGRGSPNERGCRGTVLITGKKERTQGI